MILVNIMDYVLYGIPILAFIVISYILYSSRTDKEAEVNLQNIFLPSFFISCVVYLVIKYRDSDILSDEPMKFGDYFDTTLPT